MRVNLLLLLLLLLLSRAGWSSSSVLLSGSTASAPSPARTGAETSRPNIILLVADDQDLLLDSLRAQPSLRRLVSNAGRSYTNAFCTTPICCPSRSSILTGRYVHNTGVINNTVPYCNSYLNGHENRTVATALQATGYRTFYTGKYQNQYSNYTHVPPGWTDWFALLGNSVYYNYSVSDNGVRRNYSDQPTDYFTDVVRHRSNAWLEEAISMNVPFFMHVNPPAPHRPATGAPRYQHLFSDVLAPRDAAYNVHQPDKHWMVRATYPMNASVQAVNDALYRGRLQTLVSVDDIVSDLFEILERHQQLDNTYFIYTSDHGYHIGHFGLQGEKRQPYEQELRVPLFIRGPGIAPFSQSDQLTLLLDLVPSILDLAGVEPEWPLDGRSVFKDDPLIDVERSPPPRELFLVEYWGQWVDDNKTFFGECQTFDQGFIHDCRNNTFHGVRLLNDTHNFLYAEWIYTGFVELYNVATDPLQLYNLASDPATAALRHELALTSLELLTCGGERCNVLSDRRRRRLSIE